MIIIASNKKTVKGITYIIRTTPFEKFSPAFFKRRAKTFNRGNRVVAIENAKRKLKTAFLPQNLSRNAEISTFTIIKVVNTSLLFHKVVILYKVRNFAEHLHNFSQKIVFNKIL